MLTNRLFRTGLPMSRPFATLSSQIEFVCDGGTGNIHMHTMLSSTQTNAKEM